VDGVVAAKRVVGGEVAGLAASGSSIAMMRNWA
jgi:hypothetical protein